jgi:hypothetical protein
LKQEWQKSPALGPDKQMAKNLVWFGEIEKNSPSYKCLPLLTVRSLNYFMVTTQRHQSKMSSSKQMAEKSSPGASQTEGKNLVWFGEMENKPNCKCLPLLTILPLNCFMVTPPYNNSGALGAA